MAQVYKLPTKGRSYKGKYPYRLRSLSNGGREHWIAIKHFPDLKSVHHIELNNGDRYIVDGPFLLSQYGVATTHKEVMRREYRLLDDMAVKMSQEAYDLWIKDIRIAREAWESDYVRDLQRQKIGLVSHRQRAAIEDKKIAYVKAQVEGAE